jgi:hypothetical protein
VIRLEEVYRMQLGRKVTIGMLFVVVLVAGCSATTPQSGQVAPTVGVQQAAGQASATAPAPASTVVPATATVPAATPTVASTAAVAPTTGNPLDALSSAVHTFTAVTSYRMTITIVGGTESQNGTYKLEIATGGDFHILAKTGEFYKIGDTFYVKQGANGKWLKIPTATASGLTGGLFSPRDLVLKATTAKNVSLVGPDILNGKPMLVYQYTPDPTQQSNTVSGKIWIGVPDGLPYQAIGLEKNGATTIVVFSDYNASITLTPPIP